MHYLPFWGHPFIVVYGYGLLPLAIKQLHFRYCSLENGGFPSAVRNWNALCETVDERELERDSLKIPDSQLSWQKMGSCVRLFLLVVFQIGVSVWYEIIDLLLEVYTSFNAFSKSTALPTSFLRVTAPFKGLMYLWTVDLFALPACALENSCSLLPVCPLGKWDKGTCWIGWSNNQSKPQPCSPLANETAIGGDEYYCALYGTESPHCMFLSSLKIKQMEVTKFQPQKRSGELKEQATWHCFIPDSLYSGYLSSVRKRVIVDTGCPLTWSWSCSAAIVDRMCPFTVLARTAFLWNTIVLPCGHLSTVFSHLLYLWILF